MSYNASAELLLIGLFVGMILCLLIGQRLGRRDRADAMDSTHPRLAAVEAAIFGLMGLMIAFTFSGASDRFEFRRQLVVEEANSIRTSYMRLDLLPATRQPALRDKYRLYLETRLGAYRALPDLEASNDKMTIASALQQEIWAATVTALAEVDPEMMDVVLSPLNHMIDVTTSRAAAAMTHTPKLIMAMLVLLSLVCALLAGYVIAGSHTRQVGLHLLAFALVMTATIYLVIDLDYPRYGIIRVDFVDKALEDVLVGMK
ncbi:MAG: hypothetical protein P0120_04605 [Nitrospira sp.]|nr:hypothetical protein [Nitrospira sp.]